MIRPLLLAVLAYIVVVDGHFLDRRGDLGVLITWKGFRSASETFLERFSSEVVGNVGQHLNGREFNTRHEIDLGLCSGHVKVKVTNVQLQDLEWSDLQFAPSEDYDQLRATVTAKAGLSGRLRLELTCGRSIAYPSFDWSEMKFVMKVRRVSTNVKKNLSFQLFVREASFTLGASSSDSTDPVIDINFCSPDLSSAKIYLSLTGDALASIINSVANDDDVLESLRELSEELLQKQACRQMPNVARLVNNELRKIPIEVDLPEGLGVLHWELVRALSVRPDGVMLRATGVVVPQGWTLNQTLDSLMEQGAMNESLIDIDKDLNVLLDSTLINTVLQSAYVAGHLQRELPSDLLPPDFAPYSPARLALKIVCSAHDTSTPLTVHVRASQSPVTQIYDNGIHIQLEALADAVQDNGTALLTVGSSVDLTADINIDSENNVTFRVMNISQSLWLVNCSFCDQQSDTTSWDNFLGNLGSMLGVQCGNKVKELLSQVGPTLGNQIQEIINELGSKGLQLPQIPVVSLQRPDVRYAPRTVAFVTDFELDDE